MSIERVYEGESRGGNLQEALEAALHRLNSDLSADGIRDASASWLVTEISGQYGGIAGLHSVKVKIAAKRSPAWGLS